MSEPYPRLSTARRLVLILALALSALPVSAEAERAGRMVSAFVRWAGDNGTDQGAIAVTRDGAVVRDHAIGGTVEAPRELASLSKAITAVCVADLVSDGHLAWHDDMAALLGWNGPPAGVTVAQLVTHSGGIGPDLTQTTMPLTLGRFRPRWARAAALVEGRALGEAVYTYNNENYAVLAVVIEAVTGLPYARACAPVVAAYPSARPSPLSGAFLPWGGWQMSVDDYARFHAARFADHAPQGPLAAIDGPVGYGLGMFHRDLGGVWSAWHFGLQCFPGRLEAGAFSATWPGGWGATMAFDRCPDWEALIALDAALTEELLTND